MVTTFIKSTKSPNLKVGIVGLPNIGKSTLFNVLTKNSVAAKNFPFCTVEPNIGEIEIEDSRLDVLSKIYKPNAIIKARLGVTDIAGLVKGASENVGLGNNFLSHIRSVDAIFHVVRCFEDNEIIHVESGVDPLRDIQIVNDELRLKDLDLLSKYKDRMVVEQRGKALDKKTKDKFDLVDRVLNILQTSWVNEHEFTEEEIIFISDLDLLTTKNVVYLANVSEEHYTGRKINKHLKALLGFTRNVIIFSGIHENNSESRTSFINKLLKKGYELLDLINFFTCGKQEVRSWTIRRNIYCPEAAAVIHSDFRKYFIAAEIMSYDDLSQTGDVEEVKRQGKYRLRGKKHIVCDGDIILFKHNAPSAKTSKKK